MALKYEAGGMETAVRASLKKMVWLEEIDQAAVTLALTYARAIDEAGEEGKPGEGEVGHASLPYIGIQLRAILKDLGAIPDGVEKRRTSSTTGGSRLAALRSVG